jgi:hypothetical protein
MSDLFRIVKFERSHLPQKKYNAIIEDVKTRKRMRVPFGSSIYQQYRDDVPLKLYRRLDHNDEKRRKNYLSRHEKTRHKRFSPSWLSSVYLWDGNRK